MANQYPNIVPPGFNGTYTDFNKAKIDRSGALRLYSGQVPVPAATPIGSKIGIVPVRKGARVCVDGAMLWSDALGTSVTGTVGVTYNPNSTQTEVPAQYVASVTTFAAGGAVNMNQVEGGLYYTILDDGWITVTTAGAATTGSAVNINYNIAISYDAGALQ